MKPCKQTFAIYGLLSGLIYGLVFLFWKGYKVMEQLEIAEFQTQGFEVKKLDTDDFLSSDQMNWSVTLCCCPCCCCCG